MALKLLSFWCYSLFDFFCLWFFIFWHFFCKFHFLRKIYFSHFGRWTLITESKEIHLKNDRKKTYKKLSIDRSVQIFWIQQQSYHLSFFGKISIFAKWSYFSKFKRIWMFTNGPRTQMNPLSTEKKKYSSWKILEKLYMMS